MDGEVFGGEVLTKRLKITFKYLHPGGASINRGGDGVVVAVSARWITGAARGPVTELILQRSLTQDHREWES